MVTYTSEFKEILKLARDKGLFLGTGNPNAKMIFIGKEAAIDERLYPEQYNREIENNIADWENNEANKTLASAVDNWFEVPKYNPLYPYKGQENKIESRNKTGEIIRGAGGTSKTWHNYQKIIDHIYYKNAKCININFHEQAFISELNQVTGPYSKTIPKEIRKKSINERKELFKEPFFRQFPITIVAVGHYIKEFDLDLEKIFDVEYDFEKSQLYSDGLIKEFINIHFDSINKPTRLLIHTNQLSMVSNELVFRLGEICKAFLNGFYQQLNNQ